MNLRLLVWNMNHWQQPIESRSEAWSYLSSRIQPDVCFLQEFVPEGKDGDFHFAHNAFSTNSPWGTTIVSFRGELDPVNFPVARQGSITCAQLPGVEQFQNLAFVSVYGIVDDGFATHNMHHVFSDLTLPIVKDMKKKSFIIGGDFNTSTQWEEGGKRWPGTTPSMLFDRIEDFGLINVTKHFYGGHVQTFRHKTSKYPWQNDYAFVSKDLIARATKCEVISDEVVEAVSDHNPIVIDFDLE